MSFALVILSVERKFLSRKVVETPVQAGQVVADLLAKEVVGSISVSRAKPKQTGGEMPG